jgi:anti-sigma factor RsiW
MAKARAGGSVSGVPGENAVKLRRRRKHIELATLVRYREGELSADSLAAVENHLASCEACNLAVHRLDSASQAAWGAGLPQDPNPVPSAAGLARLLQEAHHWRAGQSSLELERRIAAGTARAVRFYLGESAASSLLMRSVTSELSLLARAEGLLASFVGRAGASAVTSRIAGDAASEFLAGRKTAP